MTPDKTKVQSLYNQFTSALLALETVNNPRVVKAFTEDVLSIHAEARELKKRIGPYKELIIICSKTPEQWLIQAKTQKFPRKNYL